MKRQYRPVFGLEGAERGADDGDAGGADSSRVYVCAMIAWRYDSEHEHPTWKTLSSLSTK